MKSDERHQLEQNELADWVARLGVTARPYLPYAAAILAVAFLAAMGYSFWSSSAEAREHEAWEEFFGAKNPEQLRIVIDRYPNSQAAPYSQLRIADFEFQDAKAKLVNDYGAAISGLSKAVDLYRELADGRASPIQVKQQASMAMAETLESKGSLTEAKEAYQRVASNYAGSAEAALAEQRLKELDSPEARQFYTKLKDYKPPVPSTNLPAKSGERDLKGLEDERPPVVTPAPPLNRPSKAAPTLQRVQEKPGSKSEPPVPQPVKKDIKSTSSPSEKASPSAPPTGKASTEPAKAVKKGS